MASNDMSFVTTLKSLLNHKFNLMDLDPLKYFLGLGFGLGSPA